MSVMFGLSHQEYVTLLPKSITTAIGIALSREKILNSVWNYDYFGDARTIDTHVKKLRSKMFDLQIVNYAKVAYKHISKNTQELIFSESNMLYDKHIHMLNIGEQIKRRRLELGLSQAELAEKCGYKGKASINKIEKSFINIFRKSSFVHFETHEQFYFT